MRAILSAVPVVLVSVLLASSQLSLAAGGLAASISFPSTPLSADEVEVEAVLIRYLDGLVNGDAQAVVSLVGGRFVEERSDLAGNPSYPGRIKEHYSDASFNVVSFRTLPRYAVTDSGIRQDVIAVTVDILQGGEVADEVVLIFARDDGASASGPGGLSAVSQYRIVDEIDPSELPP